MAIEAMVAVFEESRSEGNDRLVLLALANQASAHGELSAYPRSQKYLAGLANCSVSTVRRSLSALAALGEIEVTNSGLGHKQSSYFLHLPGLCRRRACECGGEGVCSTLNTPDETNPEQSDRSWLTRLSAQGGAVHHPVLPSLPGTTTADAESGTDESSNSSATTGPAALEDLFQEGFVRGTVVPQAHFERMDTSAKRMLLDSLGLSLSTPKAAARTATEPPVASEVAPSTVEPPERTTVIRRLDGLLRVLKRGHGWEPSSQTDHRNAAKLLDLKPTLSQIDGAVEAVRSECGGKLEMGRLVSKWSTYSQFGAKRPEGWQTPRKREQDRAEAHVAAGGDRYARDGQVDYGL